MSKAPDPFSTDFHALNVLARVYRLGSFTKTAESLDLNQSAISYTIDKLRHIFSDPLFVREGRRLLPTARCEEIVPEAERLLRDFSMLAKAVDFDPSTTSGRFTIACNYYERVLYIPKIVQTLKATAPNISLEIIDSADHGHEKLLDASADLLIGPFERYGAAFYSRFLYDEQYVCLMDPNHPMAGRTLSLKDYLSLQHVYVTYGGQWKSQYILELEKQNQELKVAIRIPSPAAIDSLVLGTDFVATVPERLSRQIGKGLCISNCPVPAPITIKLVWTARNHASPMHKWVREQIQSVIAEIA